MSNIVNICTADIICSFVRKNICHSTCRKLHVTVLLHLLLNKLPNDLGFITKNLFHYYCVTPQPP
jgi:hypothetical protein